jgi:hypothetical protein
MLSDEEKNKIRLEEAYRNEVKKLGAKKSLFDYIEGPSKLFQAVAIIVGVSLSLLQYRSNSTSERKESARDYQKTFYQSQMNVYAEAVNSTSIVSTADPKSEYYQKGREQFFQLFWGRMSMFEDKCVEQKMIQFRKLLIKFENEDFSSITFYDSCNNRKNYYDTVSQVTLKLASLQLAHQCRAYTITRWLPPEEQKSYNLDINQ